MLRLSSIALGLMAIGLFAVYELCFRIGRSRPDELREERRSQIDLVVTALLTILGLLLAFSFELGASQFEKRRDLVVDDANAITTAYLRASLLPSPHDANVRELLRDYLAKRAGVTSPAHLNATMREASALHAKLWSEATLAAHERYDSPMIAQFIDSLNQVIDLEAAQVNAALFQRLPRAIFWVLYFISFVAIGMFGLRGGYDRSRGVVSAIMLIVVIMTVIGLVDALDNPVSQVFKISKHAIRDAQQVVNSTSRAPDAAMQP